MKIQHIRNATMRMTYAGRKILTDPMLAPKDAYDPFARIARNPTIDLPLSPKEVIEGVEVGLEAFRDPKMLSMHWLLAIPFLGTSGRDSAATG